MQNAFHNKLDDTENLLFKMGDIIDDIFDRLLGSYQKRSMNEAELTIILELDSQLDELEIKVETVSTEMLALHQPMGVDLRFILSALKISSNLERIGDHLRKIARKTRKAIIIGDFEHFYSITEMIILLRQMSQQIMISLKERNLKLSNQTLEMDEKVDALQRDLFNKLIEKMSKNSDPNVISLDVYLLFITRFLERIGDHIENIGERIAFIVNGKIKKI